MVGPPEGVGGLASVMRPGPGIKWGVWPSPHLRVCQVSSVYSEWQQVMPLMPSAHCRIAQTQQQQQYNTDCVQAGTGGVVVTGGCQVVGPCWTVLDRVRPLFSTLAVMRTLNPLGGPWRGGGEVADPPLPPPPGWGDALGGRGVGGGVG